MINPFKGLGALGDLQQLQQQAKQMQDALQKEEVSTEVHGVTVRARGDQKILEVVIDGVVEKRVTDAVNDAIKKTQELAAKKLLAMQK